MSGPLVLLGGGGHCRAVLFVIDRVNEFGRAATRVEVAGVLDDAVAGDGVCDRDGERDRDDDQWEWLRRRGLGVLGPLGALGSLGIGRYIVALGSGATRRQVVGSVPAGLEAATVIDPGARFGRSVQFGPGTVVDALTAFGPGTTAGSHVHVSWGVRIGRNGAVGSFASLLPGAVLGERVSLGEAAVVGSNAVVRDGVRIGAGATVGAGAVVHHDVAPGVTVVGSPARALGPTGGDVPHRTGDTARPSAPGRPQAHR